MKKKAESGCWGRLLTIQKLHFNGTRRGRETFIIYVTVVLCLSTVDNLM